MAADYKSSDPYSPRRRTTPEYGALTGSKRFQRTTKGLWWSEMVKVSHRNLPSSSGAIIKYYWSIKYIKGRDDKMNYHSLPPPYGMRFKPISSVASTGLRAELEPGHTGMSFCYPVLDGMWRCHLG